MASITFAAGLLGFLLSFILLLFFKGKLPTDIGRAYAVNAAAAKGKPRGAGIVFIPVFVIITLLCRLITGLTSGFTSSMLEYTIYSVLILGAMLTGYLDDASSSPWSELKKGLLDLAISCGCSVTFVCFNPTMICLPFTGKFLDVPTWLYIILGTILVWASINVTNCTDGVDGLSSGLAIVSLLGFAVIGGSPSEAIVLACCICGYLILNCSPSILLMGDAGSRSIGVFFAIAAMTSGQPLMYLLLCLIFILDGGLGLIKVALLRYLKIKILVNTRTPLHDHFRKNKGWSDTQVVTRFTIVHILIVATSLIFILYI